MHRVAATHGLENALPRARGSLNGWSIREENTVLNKRRKPLLDPTEVEIEEKSRRRPGQYLRDRLLDRGVFVLTITSVVFGILFSTLVYLLVVGVLGLSKEFPWFLIYFAVVGLLVTAGMTFSRRRWSPRNLFKGMESETVVADVIERSLFEAFGCFVANDVMLLGGRGNVDHIVVMPASVLVVETKYKRVRKEDFRRQLSTIDGHVRKLSQYLGADVDVTACLVFAHPEARFKKSYDFSGQSIRAFNISTLKSFLVQECRKPRSLSRDVTQRVAGLAFDS